MKKFVKKLSFVMATAMVVTSLNAPANAEAASKNFVRVKGSRKAVTSKAVYVGGRKVNFDYTVGKKTTGVKGSWMSSDTSVATVDKKTGVVTAVGNGKAVITFKTKKTKKMKKVYTMKVTVYGRTRAESVTVETPTDASVKVGKTAEFMAKLNLSEKIKAAGGKDSTYMVFAESDTTAASVKVDGMKIMVEGKEAHATPATIKVYAAQATTLEKAKASKYQAKMAEFKVAVKANFDAKQSAANKIKVMGENLIATASAYVLKTDKGTMIPLKGVTVNKEMTEAILEGTTNQFPEGKYVLTYNEKDMAEIMIERAKVQSIALIPTDKAIGVYGTADPNKTKLMTATVRYVVKDQFDNDITDSSIPRLNISGSDGAKAEGRGKVVFTSTNTQTGYTPNLSRVSVSIVDLNTGIAATATLVVSDSARVWETEFKGLWDKEKKMFVESVAENAKLENFAVAFKAKDQYGNMVDDKAAANQLNVTLISITGITVTPAKADVAKDKGEAYLIYPLAAVSKDLKVRDGEVTVQAIAINNGKMSTGKFNVTYAKKVDTLSIREGINGVYAGQENELEFTALDVDGKPVTDYETLSKLNEQTPDKFLITTGLEFRKKDNKAVLVYTPNKDIGAGAETASVPTVLNFKTQTNKFGTATIGVRTMRMPKAVLGVKDDVTTAQVADTTRKIEIKFGDLKFQDQYGNAMTAEEVVKLHGDNTYKVVIDGKTSADADFTVTQPDSAKKETNLTATNNATKAFEIAPKNAGATKTAKFTIMLKKDAAEVGAAKEISLHSVLLNDVKDLMIEDLGLQPAGDLEGLADTTFAVNVMGKYEGSKVSLKAGTDFVVFDDATTSTFKAPEMKTIPRGSETAKAKVKVVVSKAEPVTLEKEFTYSKAAPHVAKVEVKNSEELMANTDKGWNDIKGRYTITDQYKKEINKDPYITFSDYGTATVKNNGTKSATIMVTDKRTVKVKFVFPGTTYVYEGELKLKQN